MPYRCVTWEWEQSWMGVSPTTTLWGGLYLKMNPAFELTSNNLVNLRISMVMRTHPYAHPQHIKVLKCLICVSHWSESHLSGCIASTTTTLWWGLLLRMYPQFELTSQNKSLADLRNSNVVRMHPFAHPQHVKVVKCFIFVWYWSERYFRWVYSLKHYTMMTIHLLEVPRIWGSFQKLGWLEHQYGDS